LRRTLVVCIAGILAFVLLFPAVALAKFGIEPGKVTIENLYPGAEADVPITIYNQNDYASTFLVKARSPDYTETGYEPLPYLDWISIEPEQVTIDAQETSEVLVVIIMPEDAVYSGKKAEVWISFTEEGKPGEMIQVEIASRLLISTRVEEESEPAEPAQEPEPAEEPEPAKPEAVTVQPTEEPEPAKPGAVTVQPAVEGDGTVGITAEGERTEEGESRFPWLVVGPVLGVVAIVGLVFFLRRARQRT